MASRSRPRRRNPLHHELRRSVWLWIGIPVIILMIVLGVVISAALL